MSRARQFVSHHLIRLHRAGSDAGFEQPDTLILGKRWQYDVQRIGKPGQRRSRYDDRRALPTLWQQINNTIGMARIIDDNEHAPLACQPPVPLQPTILLPGNSCTGGLQSQKEICQNVINWRSASGWMLKLDVELAAGKCLKVSACVLRGQRGLAYARSSGDDRNGATLGWIGRKALVNQRKLGLPPLEVAWRCGRLNGNNKLTIGRLRWWNWIC